jgi:hypothetical protein
MERATQVRADRGGIAVGGTLHGGAHSTYIENQYILQLPRAEEDDRTFSPLLRDRFGGLLGRYRIFGGRSHALGEIDAFVREPTGAYLFVTGRSGYGKTALLAHWVTKRMDAGATPCFHFLSRADETADESFTLRNLCEQLLRARERRAPLDASTDLRALYSAALRMPASDGQPIVVVIDGVDEADGWRVGPELFPSPLPDGVCVVFSAREMADRDWLGELGLPAATPTLTLDRLTREEISDVLLAAGPAGEALLRDPRALETIEEISDGEPYYIGNLVKDLLDGSLTDSSQLSEWPRGLARYFDRWWTEMTAAHGEQPVQEMLAYLLAAKGPLTRQDLVEISPEDSVDDWTVDQAVARAERHIVGDRDSGYKIGHARFREYLVTTRLSAEVVDRAADQLLAFGARWPKEKSEYAFAHYAAHLRERDRNEDLFALMESSGWHDRQLEHDPSGGSFLSSVREAWQVARARADADAAAGQPSKWLGREIACALGFASVRSVLGGMPHELLRALLVSRRWSEDDVLAAVREAPEARKSADAIELLAPELSPEGARAALAIAQTLPDFVYLNRDEYSPRPTALAALAPRLAADSRDDILDALFAARERVGDKRWVRVVTADPLLALLQPARLREALGAAGRAGDVDSAINLLLALRTADGDPAALEAIGELSGDELRTECLTRLAPGLDTSAIRPALDLALVLAPDVVEDDQPVSSPRAAALAALAPLLDAEAADSALSALAPVRNDAWRAWAALLLSVRLGDRRNESMQRHREQLAELGDPGWRLRALLDVMPELDRSERAQAASEAVSIVDEIAEDGERERQLTMLAPVLEPAEAATAVELVFRPGGAVLAGAAVALVARVDAAHRGDLVRRVLRAIDEAPRDDAEGLGNGRPHVAIVQLAAHLPSTEADEILGRELEHAGDTVLGAVAEVADPGLWPRLIEAASQIHPMSRPDALAGLLERAPDEYREQVADAALRAARTVPLRESIDDEAGRAKALARVASLATPDARSAILEEALDAAQRIDDAGLRARCGCALIGSLDEETALDVLDRLESVGDPEAKSAALAQVRELPGGRVSERAVALAAGLPDAGLSAQTLAALASAATPDDRGLFVDALRKAISESPDPASVLADIAGYAPDFLIPTLVELLGEVPVGYAAVHALNVLAPRLEDELLARALNVAVGMPPDQELDDGRRVSWQAGGLGALADVLPPDLASEAVEAAMALPSPGHAYPTAAMLAPHLRGDQRKKLVAHLAAAADRQTELGARVAVTIPTLPAAEDDTRRRLVDGLLRELENAAPDPDTTGPPLIELAPFVDGDLADRAFRLARQFGHPAARGYFSAPLYPRIAPEARRLVLSDVLDDVRQLEPEEVRCNALTYLAAAVEPQDREDLTEEALADALALGGEGLGRARRLLAEVALPPDAASSIVERALRRALTLDGGNRLSDTAERPASALTHPVTGFRPGSVPSLEGNPFGSMREMPSGVMGFRADDPAAVAIVSQGHIINVLHARADQLPQPGTVAALESALATLHEHRPELWTRAVEELLPHLPAREDSVGRVRDRLGPVMDQAIVVEVLAPPLPRWLTPEPIGVRDHAERSRTVRALRVLVPLLAELELPVLRPVWREFLSAFAGGRRPELLVHLGILAPLIMRLGEAAGASATVGSLDRVGSWWP